MAYQEKICTCIPVYKIYKVKTKLFVIELQKTSKHNNLLLYEQQSE